jgi:hypothetical protein
MPYSKLVKILRYTLKQVERDLSLNPESAELAELKRSLQVKLKSLEHRANVESDEGTTE